MTDMALARRLNHPDLALLSEAFLLVAASSVAIRWLRFPQVAELACWPLAAPRKPSPASLPERVQWAVMAAAKRSPWRAVCFQRGLAAQIMLRRRGIDSRMYFGVAPDKEKGLAAHVWVRAGDIDVIGCEEAPGFAVLAVFPAAPPA